MEQSLAEGEIFIVDDDPMVRDMLSTLFTLEGYQVESFAEGTSFLAATRGRKPACVLLDVNMPGRSGIDILKELHACGYPVPVFMISGQADVPLAVDAIKSGAVDVIEKPFNIEAMLERVRQALTSSVQKDEAAGGMSLNSFPGHHALTPRERDVLAMIANGSSNKEAGQRLKISPRTVEVHRARIMTKLGAKNAADLVRIVLRDGRSPHQIAS